MNIVMMGIQGSGKGTQAKLLAEHLGCPHISTGDVFRENISGGTDLGKKVRQYTDKGELVPDGIVIDMVRSRLEKPDTEKGFILDGFPRNGVQLAALEYFRAIDRAFLLELDDETAIKRLAGRIECRKCNIIYGANRKPKKHGFCDECDGPLTERTDDKDVEAVEKRLSLYHFEIRVLLGYYEWKGALRRIDASADVETVHKFLMEAIDGG
ncbi:MAG: adenylate kinase family protein [Planctomycetota bacterium]|jgi:adenylate kinase